MQGSSQAQAYWKANISIIMAHLAVWFIVSYGCGILFIEQLNNFNLFGYPLGFWFAQQGSMYFFLILIVNYAFMMNNLDKKYGVEE